MRRFFLKTILCCLFTTSIFSQFTTDEITYGNRIDLENSNSWAVGAGVSNFIMHGDLRSIGTGNLGNFYNFGAFAFVDKMFNPLLGLEFKATYSQISGGAQYFSDVYEVLYVPNTVIRDNTFFEGTAYGAELNLIFSFTNLYQTSAYKWHAAGYFGVGYHQYDSQLFEKNLNGGPDRELVDFGFNPARDSQNQASSIYLSAQLGIKRRLSKKVDLELRSGMYFNYEDHLDAAISNKQDWETFFVTSIGVVVKLGKKKVFTIWGNEGENAQGKFKIVDTDKDGVMDELDVEPNTPPGVMVYGNGKAVDSDKDGIPDYLDKCPLVFGPESNEGCPLNIDSDGDGIMDDQDLCPATPGILENRGCPEQKIAAPTGKTVSNEISLLAASIYFETNSDKIQNISFANIDKIIALMKKVPEVRFRIEGHTDDRNSDRYNLYLSQRRANAVRKYMIKEGIDQSRLEAKGFGESRPKFSNENAGGRQLNRRVEIKPTNSLE
ncbi:OmpA family protein [uncultured Polaribacter sp.]|uniref:OmpA family protein n=1 Tax=uncultured Polaribacter sp. TaxID=174711 RepID=UPI0026163BF5|nr:OmpA family protein [uncultured Polaribacter sp.]